MKASISSLQNKSSADFKSNIHCSSKIITSSNHTNSSEMSGLCYASNVTTGSNSRSFSNDSLVFSIGITSNENRLNITISQKAFPSVLPKNQYLKK